MSARLARAAVTSAALSILFLAVYGVTNQLSALRPDVGTVAFAWERHIPFVTAMIVPYLSIDLFFVAAPFLCAVDDERRRLAARISMAILMAGACFLLFPLRFAFPRPPAEGSIGAAFDLLRALDLPYNLAPSLHVALGTILANHYAQHTRGLLRLAVHGWFCAIALSTLLVWQHHVVDVLSGLLLGAACLFVLPSSSVRRELVPNPRVALRYAAGCVVVCALSVVLSPWGALLLWPAFSLGLMAAAYLRLGASVFRKESGVLPLSAKLALGPVLLGQYLSLLYYRRRCRPWDAVTPAVWIGRRLNDREAAAAVREGVTAVLDLTGEFSAPAPFRSVVYQNIPVLDLTAPTPAQLRAISDFIATQSTRGVVYVHCKIGYSRSAAAVAAFLLASRQVPSVEAALIVLRQARPTIVVRDEIVAALRGFAASLPSAAPVVV